MLQEAEESSQPVPGGDCENLEDERIDYVARGALAVEKNTFEAGLFLHLAIFNHR